MIRIRQLCGGGLYGDVPYWTDTIWCGVTLERARFWLKHCGWGPPYLGPLRIRLKGRCWIERAAEPAVAYVDGEPHAGKFPPRERPAEPVYRTSRKPRKRRQRHP